MLKENLYIEDLILCIAGIAPIDEDRDPPKIMPGDFQLIHSFGKQILRNLGFTDKQNELAKRKVEDYKSYFSFIPNLAEIKSRNRLPVREIDRSRWIHIVENSKGDYEIAVRFTFQKNLISSIDEIKKNIGDRGSYDKEFKIHSFEYSERNLFEIVKAFAGKHFELDETAKEIYEKLDHLDPIEHVPGVYDYKVLNLHPNGLKLITEELGEPNKDNILLYQDRSIKYGLSFINDVERTNVSSLAYKIAHRKYPSVSINQQKTNVDSLLLSLEELQRFPLLILVSQEQCYDVIVQLQEYVRNLIPNEQVSVMFRLDNQGEGIQFNDYIREQKINNKVDNNTKIVYCLDNKIPKPLLNSNWRPNTILLYGARPVGGRKVVDCYSDNDLIIHYEDGLAPMNYFYRTEVEGID